MKRGDTNAFSNAALNYCRSGQSRIERLAMDGTQQHEAGNLLNLLIDARGDLLRSIEYLTLNIDALKEEVYEQGRTVTTLERNIDRDTTSKR